MARFCATHLPFWQNTAKLLVLPLAKDGTMLDNVLLRTKVLYPCHYAIYRQTVLGGNLSLGDVLIHKVNHQVAGLGVGDNRKASHIASLITTHHAKHQHSPSIIHHSCRLLAPKLFELMRYQGVRHVAILTTPILSTQDQVYAQKLWEILQTTLDVPNVSIDVHFPRHITLDF